MTAMWASTDFHGSICDFDADPDPDPAVEFDADPTFHSDADLDPAS